MKTQTVVFLRHGVAKHNFRGANLEDPALFDPPLVPEGKVSAVQAGERISSFWKTTQLGEDIEVILTSPLTRCMQTTMLAFLPGDEYREENTSDRPQHPPRILCIEDLREAYGKHYPDRRRNKSLLQRYWPAIQFESGMTEADEKWAFSEREGYDSLQGRIAVFMLHLSQLKEENIVVVSHGVWIETMIHMYCPRVLEGGRRVYNLDSYAFRLHSENANLRLEFMQKI